MVNQMGRWTVRYIHQLVVSDIAKNVQHSVFVTCGYQVCLGLLNGFLSFELPMGWTQYGSSCNLR